MTRWPTRPLKAFCVEVDERCGSLGLPVFSVSKTLGIVPQTERFKKRIASSDTSRYKILRPGEFAFDPMLLWSGSVSRNTSKVTGVVSPAYSVFRALDTINPRFLHLYLTQAARLPFYDSISFGTNERRRKARFADLGELEVPEPPLPEQARLVSLLAEGDALNHLRLRAFSRAAQLRPALFSATFGDPFTNPNHWPSRTLGDITTVKTGRTPSRSLAGNFGGSIPWVKTTEVNGTVIMDTVEKLTEQGLLSVRGQLFPRGSILIAMYGQGRTRGQSGVLGTEAFCNQACAVLLPNDSMLTEYALTFLEMSYHRIRRLAHGASQDNLNLQMIRSVAVPLPPIPLQEEFAQRVGEIRQMQAIQTDSRHRVDALLQSLLQRVFDREV